MKNNSWSRNDHRNLLQARLICSLGADRFLPEMAWATNQNGDAQMPEHQNSLT